MSASRTRISTSTGQNCLMTNNRFYSPFGALMGTPPSSDPQGKNERLSLPPEDLGKPVLAATTIPADSPWRMLHAPMVVTCKLLIYKGASTRMHQISAWLNAANTDIDPRNAANLAHKQHPAAILGHRQRNAVTHDALAMRSGVPSTW